MNPNDTRVDPMIDPTDIDRYETHLMEFQAGRLAPQDFLSERLLRGVYAQRQEGWFMVRTKLPAGGLDAGQLRGLAGALQHYSQGGQAHLTTRQDVQLYQIRLQDTPALLRLLARHGITTREAAGNTVRNVTTCPLAGACPRERVDVEPYALGVTRHFIGHPLTQSLPRKFKIAFSGCAGDCARGKVHDLGFIAERRDGRPGFQVLAGGGLGAKPRLGFVLEPFIEEADLLPVIEAVLALHGKHSDRTRKTRSRLKFLVERFGAAGFRAKYRQELKRSRAAFDPANAPLVDWRPEGKGQSFVERDYLWLGKPMPMAWGEGFLVPLKPPGGNLSAAQLLGLAEMVSSGESLRLRATQSQGLLLSGVPASRLEEVQTRLATLALAVPTTDVASCPGVESCPLGITHSARMATALEGIAPGLRVRVNGCQNGCAWGELADIGLIGKGRRHHGQMVPTYAVRLGGGESLGLDGPEIPAVRVPSALRLISNAYAVERKTNETFPAWCRRKGEAQLRQLLENLVQVGKSEIPFLIRDQGDREIFQVTAVGSGECAGGRSNPVDKLLLSAAYESSLSRAFQAKQKYAEAGECLRNRLRLTGRALLLAANGDEKTPETLSADLAKALSEEDKPLIFGFEELDGALNAFLQDPDETLFPGLLQRNDDWADSIRGKCRALQARQSRGAG